MESAVQRARTEFNEPEQAMPSSGTTRRLTSAEGVGPLEIRPSADASYLVKLVDASTKTTVMTIFVRSGVPTEVKIPLGTYEMRYAAGERWYGYDHLFGPRTSYSKADRMFTFDVVGNQIRGYTVTLYRVPHGNLHTSSIPPDAF